MVQTNIILSHVTKYYKEKPVLEDFSFTFQNGQKYCIMAPSGGGKTTLFKIIMGLEAPDSGTVSTCPVSGRFGAVFQEDRLLPGYSAADNIRFVTGRQLSDAQLHRVLSRLLPADSLSKPVSEFSGGMKRRLAILRALLAPSDFLIMDEPFSGLDAETKRAAILLILELKADRLLLVSTHNPEDAALLGASPLHLPVIC